MQTEIEAKFTDINVELLRGKLEELGAKLVHPERIMRRRNYDFLDGKLESASAWVRVRDEGNKITMSYKQNKDDSLHGTVEVNIAVDDFNTAHAFLEALGVAQKSYQETKRECWLMDEVEITIDTWPWIPSFVELEGPSEEAVKNIAGRLGLDWSNALHGSVATVYQLYYNVTADEVNAWEIITFQAIPEELDKVRLINNGQAEKVHAKGSSHSQ